MADTTIPEFFTQPQGAPVASYDWADLTQAVGYKYFYPAAAELSGSVVYFAQTKSNYEGVPLYTGVAGSGVARTAVIDKDFDLTFGTTAIIKGELYANVTHGASAVTADKVLFQNVELNVYHVQGTTETLLGTAESKEREYTTTIYTRESIKVTLSQKKFVPGDILRLNFRTKCRGSDAGTSYTSRLYHDPSSRLSVTDTAYTGTVGTDIECQVPFKIDI